MAAAVVAGAEDTLVGPWAAETEAGAVAVAVAGTLQEPRAVAAADGAEDIRCLQQGQVVQSSEIRRAVAAAALEPGRQMSSFLALEEASCQIVPARVGVQMDRRRILA